MARPKSFNQAQALEKAMHLFWEKGFEATSIQDLVDHVGINRQSIYDTFGDKKQLFLSCLELYRNRDVEQQPFDLQGQTIQEVFSTIFSFLIEEFMSDDRGCLIANSTLELASRDVDVANIVCRNMESHEATFRGLLIAAQEKGELSADKDCEAIARYLFNSIQGLRLTAKTSADRARLEDIARITLSVLN